MDSPIYDSMANEAELGIQPGFLANHESACQRDADPDGDPDAADPGGCEEPSDTDPAPQLNADADDDFSDLEEGEDDGQDDDLDDDPDDKPDDSPADKPDDQPAGEGGTEDAGEEK